MIPVGMRHQTRPTRKRSALGLDFWLRGAEPSGISIISVMPLPTILPTDRLPPPNSLSTDHIMDNAHPTPSPCADTFDAFAQYHRLATDSITDAQNWMRACSLARAIPEAMPDAMVVIDEAGLIVSVNAQFELMFGYHRSQVVGQPPEMLMPNAFRDCRDNLRHGFIHDPRVRDMAGSQIARRKNGVEIPVEIRLGPVVTPDGAFIIATIRRVRT
jgi:PAS domain S-box-containing protein